jgi:hypothetical protein
VRAFCRLCLAVQLVFWLELAVMFGLGPSPAAGGAAWGSAGLGLAVAVAGWAAVAPLVGRAEAERLERGRAEAWQRRPDVVRGVVADATLALGALPGDVLLGAPGAARQLGLVAKADCVGCARAHAFLSRAVASAADDIEVRVRVLAPAVAGGAADRLVDAVTALALEGEHALGGELLAAWFAHLLGQPAPAPPPVPQVGDAVVRARAEASAWAESASLTATPRLAYAGRVLPLGLSPRAYATLATLAAAPPA